MDKALRAFIKEQFFELRDILDRTPVLRGEAFRALRAETIINSAAIDFEKLNPAFLRLADSNTPIRKWDKISPNYHRAMAETLVQFKVADHMEEVAVSRTEPTMEFLLAMHREMFERTQYGRAGKFRSDSDRPSPIGNQVPHPSRLPGIMEHHLIWLTHRLQMFPELKPENFLEIFHVSAEIHYRILNCMPFDCGNGRMARLMGDFVLLRNNLLYNVISYDNREEYIHVLNKLSIDDLAPLVNFLIKSFGDSITRVRGFVKLASHSPHECRANTS